MPNIHVFQYLLNPLAEIDIPYHKLALLVETKGQSQRFIFSCFLELVRILFSYLVILAQILTNAMKRLHFRQTRLILKGTVTAQRLIQSRKQIVFIKLSRCSLVLRSLFLQIQLG